ncbi:hypothetical protein [Desulfosporosinus shakirovi]|nr:hypothetical protein [Desulfosporosinus sp. SRJS8]
MSRCEAEAQGARCELGAVMHNARAWLIGHRHRASRKEASV